MTDPKHDAIISRTDAVIWTEAGYVDFLNPLGAGSQITVEAIALPLSRLPRFGGHTRADMPAYTVAEHLIWCAQAAMRRGLPRHIVRATFLHDAPEYVLGDVVTRLKQRLQPIYGAIEASMLEAIAFRFGLPCDKDHAPMIYPEVKEIDLCALATEKRDLLPDCPPWHDLPEPDRATITPVGDEEWVRDAFVQMAKFLGVR